MIHIVCFWQRVTRISLHSLQLHMGILRAPENCMEDVTVSIGSEQMMRFHRNSLLSCSGLFVAFITTKAAYTDFWVLRIQSGRCQGNTCGPHGIAWLSHQAVNTHKGFTMTDRHLSRFTHCVLFPGKIFLLEHFQGWLLKSNLSRFMLTLDWTIQHMGVL